MIDFFLIFLICMVVFLYYQLLKTAKLNHAHEREHKTLEHKYTSLQKTLAARGQRLDVLLSSISEVVLRVDKQGRVLGGNAQAATLFQLDKLPNLPQSLLVLYRNSDWISTYQKAIQNLPVEEVLPEMKVRGQVFLPRLVALNENEALLLCMDVTAYTELQQKQKTLLANLMHDLKTPLTSLLGYARSIETFSDDKLLRNEAAIVIAQEAKYINSLVNSMLTLNQIELAEGGDSVVCNVRDVMRQVWKSLDFEMKQKDVQLSMDEKDIVGSITMSDVDCYRILINVADNAVRFSPRGSALDCNISEDESLVSVVIKDKGCGVPEKHIVRITERFYRVDNVRGRDKVQGHGLGLAIVKETLERDGGDLNISNIEEGGLKVELRMPKALASSV